VIPLSVAVDLLAVAPPARRAVRLDPARDLRDD
jgi:ABC-type lipoprotein release transport system permease subunit